MELVVLRNSSRYAVPLGAAAAYLVRGGGATILLGSAHGAAEALLRELGGRDLDAVVLAHYHEEALADLLPVAQAFRPRLLFAPAPAAARLRDRGEFAATAVVGVAPGSRAAIQRLRVAFGPADHGCPGVSVRFEDAAGALAFLGDTGAVAGLADFARGAATMLAHTLLLDDGPAEASRANLSAGAAGRLAREAGAVRLLLAHVPFYANAEASRAEAERAFGGRVEVVREGAALAL